MNMKYVLIGAVVIGILAILASTVMKKRNAAGAATAQGFQNQSEYSFTMYYADWCPHCQTAKPEFQELVNKGDVKVGNKACKIRMISPDEQPEAVKGKDIKGFPTFLLETAGGETFEYKGPRNTDGYLAFINEKLGGGI